MPTGSDNAASRAAGGANAARDASVRTLASARRQGYPTHVGSPLYRRPQARVRTRVGNRRAERAPARAGGALCRRNIRRRPWRCSAGDGRPLAQFACVRRSGAGSAIRLPPARTEGLLPFALRPDPSSRASKLRLRFSASRRDMIPLRSPQIRSASQGRMSRRRQRQRYRVRSPKNAQAHPFRLCFGAVG